MRSKAANKSGGPREGTFTLNIVTREVSTEKATFE